MGTTINARFKNKRGVESSLPTLLEGELYYCTDTKKLYIGSTNGNILVSDIVTFQNNLQSITDSAEKLTEITTKTTFSVTPPSNYTISESNCFKENGRVYFYLMIVTADGSNFPINTTINFTLPSNLIKHPSAITTLGLNGSVWKGVEPTMVSPSSNALIIYNNNENISKLIVTGEVLSK